MAVDNGTIYTSIRVRLDQLDTDLKSYNQRLTGLETNTKKSMGNINLAGVAAFAGIGLAIKSATNLFGDFEQSMANVGSVAGATGDEMRALTQAALDAGENTRFSASAAADALYYLASAGFDATQSISALDGVLTLAGATGSDLAQTADTMTATLAQFGLEAEESARVSNVFAAAISNSQANLSKLQTAFRQVGPIAGSFGISLEETTASLQALFNAGLQGEQAGTALRSILLDLSSATGPVAQKLIEAGLSFDQFNPQAVGLTGTIEALANSGVALTEIFGKESVAAMQILAKTSQETEGNLRDLEAAVTGTDKAAELYAMQNDTLKGSLDAMNSAIESAAIKTAGELAPAFRGIVDVVTFLVKAFSSLPGPIKAAVGIFALLLAGMVGLSIVIPLVTGLMAGLTVTIGTLTLTAGPILAIVAGISLLAGAVVGLTNEFNKQDTARIAKNYKQLAESFNLTEKELVALVRAAKSVGVTADYFAQLQKETGLATKELKGFLKVSRDLGASEKDIIAINKQFGLTASQIRSVNGQLKGVQDSRVQGITDENSALEKVASNLKLSVVEVAKIALASKDVTEEYKAQAKIIISNHEATMKAYEAEFTRYAYIEASKAGKGYLYAKQQSELAAKQLKDSEKEALNAEWVKNVEAEHLKLLQQIQFLETKKAAGQITEQEFLDEKLKAYQNEYDNLLKINGGYESTQIYYQNAKKYLEENGGEISKNAEKTQEWIDKLNSLDETAEESIEKQRQLALAGAEAGSDLEKAINAYYDRLKEDEANKKFIDGLKSITSEAKKILSSLANSYSQYLENVKQDQLDLIDENEQRELEAAGLADKTAVEQAEEKVRLAKESGDEEARIEAENELKKAQIAEKYQKQRAEIEYKADVDSWNNKWLMSIVDTAGAVVEALPNVPLSVAAGITGAINTAVILGNKPKAPSFATGGIVGGSSYAGDNVQANLNSGEAVITNEQLRTLFEFMKSNIGNNNQKIKFPEQINANLIVGETEIKRAIFKFLSDGSENNEYSINKQVLR